MSKIVFLLEERSAREMLEGLLPRVVPEGIAFQLIHFNGKSDLEKQLLRKLRYWREPDCFFVVLRDKDSGDCRASKDRLCELCSDSGHTNWLVRIACHELESWYLGDLAAVEAGLGIKGIAALQQKAKYRAPDELSNASDELRLLTDSRYDKVSGSRAIGPHLRLRDNRSHSFNIFLDSVERAIGALQRTNRDPKP